MYRNTTKKKKLLGDHNLSSPSNFSFSRSECSSICSSLQQWLVKGQSWSGVAFRAPCDPFYSPVPASDWPAWEARSWQVFGRETPVWPCVNLVIHLLWAVGSVCGNPKTCQVIYQIIRAMVYAYKCFTFTIYFGRCWFVCRIAEQICCACLLSYLVPPHSLCCCNPSLNGLGQWVRRTQGWPSLFWK